MAENTEKKIIDVDLSTTGNTKENITSFFTSPIFISIVIILVAAFGIFFLIFKTKTPDLPQANGKEAAFGQLENPKVTLETYEDFVCPHCSEFNPIFDKLIENYKDKPVKFVFRQYPFLSSYSQTAAEASEYANDKGKFKEYKDKIFEEQNIAYQAAGREDATFLKTDNLVKWGEELGLDPIDMRKQIEGRTYKTRVNDELQRGKDRGVQGTPSVFINDKIFQADGSKGIYLDLESISKQIDALLEAK